MKSYSEVDKKVSAV